MIYSILITNVFNFNHVNEKSSVKICYVLGWGGGGRRETQFMRTGLASDISSRK